MARTGCQIAPSVTLRDFRFCHDVRFARAKPRQQSARCPLLKLRKKPGYCRVVALPFHGKNRVPDCGEHHAARFQVSLRGALRRRKATVTIRAMPLITNRIRKARPKPRPVAFRVMRRTGCQIAASVPLCDLGFCCDTRFGWAEQQR